MPRLLVFFIGLIVGLAAAGIPAVVIGVTNANHDAEQAASTTTAPLTEKSDTEGDASKQGEAAEQEETSDVGKSDYGSIKITKVSRGEDSYDGKSTVRVDFTWTNTTRQSMTASMGTLDLKAKQNGRELDDAYYSLDNAARQENEDNLYATYDPDISVDGWQAYELVDESPVTITYGNWTGTYTLDGTKQ